MPDSLALSAIAVIAAGLIALALVWPQGQGARSPAPFGHPLAAIEKPNPRAPASAPTLRGPVHSDAARGATAPVARP